MITCRICGRGISTKRERKSHLCHECLVVNLLEALEIIKTGIAMNKDREWLFITVEKAIENAND